MNLVVAMDGDINTMSQIRLPISFVDNSVGGGFVYSVSMLPPSLPLEEEIKRHQITTVFKTITTV